MVYRYQRPARAAIPCIKNGMHGMWITYTKNKSEKAIRRQFRKLQRSQFEGEENQHTWAVVITSREILLYSLIHYMEVELQGIVGEIGENFIILERVTIYPVHGDDEHVEGYVGHIWIFDIDKDMFREGDIIHAKAMPVLYRKTTGSNNVSVSNLHDIKKLGWTMPSSN